MTDASGVEAYEFQVSVRSDFAKDFILHRGAIRGTDVVIPPSVGNTGGLCLCTYFWRVRTADRAGNVSAWSATRTFTVSGTAGQPTISDIAIDPSTVVGGAQATGMVNLYEAAPAGGLVARLAAFHDRSQGLDRTRTLPVPVSVPEFVTIPAGALSASLPITTTAVSDVMGVSLIGTVNGVGNSGTMSVAPADAGGPTPSNVMVLPGTVTGGTPATGIVTLNQAAPTGGSVVALSSTHPAIASVPASVTVTAGSRTATFAVATAAPTTEIEVGITARAGGSNWTRPFYVRRPNRLPKLTSMTISPSAVAGGVNSGGTLTFSGPIPPGTWPALPDAVVRFSSSDPDVAALFPGDDYVVAGSMNHTFRIFTRGVPTPRNVTLTAYFDGTALSGVLSVGAVTGVTVSSLTANVTTLRGGEGGVATITLGAAAPAPLLLTLSTNHPERDCVHRVDDRVVCVRDEQGRGDVHARVRVGGLRRERGEPRAHCESTGERDAAAHLPDRVADDGKRRHFIDWHRHSPERGAERRRACAALQLERRRDRACQHHGAGRRRQRHVPDFDTVGHGRYRGHDFRPAASECLDDADGDSGRKSAADTCRADAHIAGQ